MKFLIYIRKVQGENRHRGADNRLHATQRSLFTVEMKPLGHFGCVLRSSAYDSLSKARTKAEQMFGPLEWLGWPNYGGYTHDAETKGVALWEATR